MLAGEYGGATTGNSREKFQVISSNDVCGYISAHRAAVAQVERLTASGASDQELIAAVELADEMLSEVIAFKVCRLSDATAKAEHLLWAIALEPLDAEQVKRLLQSFA